MAMEISVVVAISIALAVKNVDNKHNNTISSQNSKAISKALYVYWGWRWLATTL